MKISRNKSKIYMTLTLTLILCATLITFPSTVAQEPPRKKTYAFIGAVPNPVGVDQTVLLHIGIPTASASVEFVWENLTVSVTKPDGASETLGPFNTDSTGGTGTPFTPNQIGTYILQTHFPEQTVPVTYFYLEKGGLIWEGTVMEASESTELELIVQEEQVEYYPGHSLPEEYWTRPIDAQSREWSEISGNWVISSPNLLAPHNKYAPETAHVLWAKPLTVGGLAGGTSGPQGMECGDAYEGKFQNPVILNGVLFYNRYSQSVFGELIRPQQGIIAVDLRTGEELWVKNNTRLAHGQTFYWDSWNFHGVFDYLWETIGSTWNAYDPYNGEWVYSMVNVPSGTILYGLNGEIYKLIVNSNNGWMALWNSTETGKYGVTADRRGSWGQNVHGRTLDASNGYSWNITIPSDLGLPAGTAFGSAMRVYPDRVVGISYSTSLVNVWALSLRPGNEGALLFDETWQPPVDWEVGDQIIHFTGATSQAEDGVISLYAKELRRHYGFSTETGDFLWETDSEHYLAIYGYGAFEHSWAFAYDKLYSTGVSGIVYCYDLETGDTLWTYEAEDPYQEILWANNWWGHITVITDGKVYVGHEEHSPIDPKPRGAPFTCLNATTGEEIWRVNGMFRQTHWGGRGIIGDSIIATMDTYDQRIYAIGKGPSETTVSIAIDVVPLGTSIMVKGTVMDVSVRFPAGVPAVADEVMSDWMRYVYKQFARPTNSFGVPVKIEAYDPNGNYQNLGTTTSDSNGNFGFVFEPEVPGTYWISATFEGSNGYYGSTTSTFLTVDPAPEPYPTVTIPPYPADPGYQGPSASDVAQNVINSLPDDATPAEIAQAVENQLTIPAATVIPEYTTMDLVILVAVAVAIVIGLVSLLRKRQ